MANPISIVICAVIIGIVLCDDCKYKDLTIKKGEDGYPKGECIRVHCIGKDNWGAVPCPQVGIPHGCKVKYEGEDLSKAYPDCCSKAYCEDKN